MKNQLSKNKINYCHLKSDKFYSLNLGFVYIGFNFRFDCVCEMNNNFTIFFIITLSYSLNLSLH